MDAALAVTRYASQFESGSLQGARRVRDAANAFQSITKLRDKVELSASENEEFELKVANLRELLEKLGEWF